MANRRMDVFAQDEEAFENQWVECDYCNAGLELSDEELSQGWYSCPECGQLSHLIDDSGGEVDPVLEYPAHEGDAGWVQLAEVAGAEESALVVSYLKANGVEAFSWQEGAGRAFGLSIGALGVSHIMVREGQEEPARLLLEAEVADNLGGEPAAGNPLPDSSKAVMGLTAVAINPLGAGLAFGISQVLGRHDDEGELTNLVECVHCGTALELSEQEVAQGAYTCPECQHTIQLSDYVVCSACESELALNEAEQTQGWYQCPECDQVTQL